MQLCGSDTSLLMSQTHNAETYKFFTNKGRFAHCEK
uniref:Uncharacterized protein n=1 Tax=Arundo donax TaxID=35708 RepID=A0A0A9HN19_ARUDO